MRLSLDFGYEFCLRLTSNRSINWCVPIFDSRERCYLEVCCRSTDFSELCTDLLWSAGMIAHACAWWGGWYGGGSARSLSTRSANHAPSADYRYRAGVRGLGARTRRLAWSGSREAWAASVKRSTCSATRASLAKYVLCLHMRLAWKNIWMN